MSQSQQQQNIIMDIRQKLQLFAHLDNSIRKMSRADVPKEVAIQSVISATKFYVSDIIPDKFVTEWKAHVDTMVPKLNEILEAYTQFLRENKSSDRSELIPLVQRSIQTIDTIFNYIMTLKANIYNWKNQQEERSNKKDKSNNQRRFVIPPNADLLKTAVANLQTTLSQIGSKVKDDAPSQQSLAHHMEQITKGIGSISFDDMTAENSLDALRTDLESSKGRLSTLLEGIREEMSSKKANPIDDFLSKQNRPDFRQLLKDELTIQTMYSKLGPSLIETMNTVSSTLKSYIASNGGDYVPQAKAAQQTLDNISAKLMFTVNDDKRMSDIDDGISRTLSSIPLGKELTKFVPLPKDAPTALHNKRLWGSVNTMFANDKSNGNGSGFLYRTVDPIRVMQYLDQIRRFRDVVSKSDLGSQIAMQSKRLTNANNDLVEKAKAINAHLNSDSNTQDDMMRKNVSEATIRIRQLEKRKDTAIRLYIRSVKSAVGTYSKHMISFVQHSHGEAIRYMAYWEQIGESGISSPELRDAISQHNAMVTEIGEICRNTIMVQAYVPFQDTMNTVLGSVESSVLTLDNEIVMAFEVERDTVMLWMENQADRIQTAFMKGSPSLMDDIFEPQQLVLWALKAMRLGVAAVSIDVAKRAFRSVYRRRVNELDQDPPSPWLFVIMFLAIDAAMHLVVLAVLFTLFKMLKHPDNNFPIDMDLISRWSMDYAMCSVFILVISLGVGYIIQNKRYFRFRHEGDRAINAFAKMVFYVYAIAVFIPFYRMTYG